MDPGYDGEKKNTGPGRNEILVSVPTQFSIWFFSVSNDVLCVFPSLPDNNLEDEGLCPSMYSFHSSVEEKNQLLFTLTQYGIETTVDRRAKKDRIRDWIQASVITEVPEDEEEEEDDIEEEERQKEREAMEGKRDSRHKKDKETPANTSRSASQ